MKKNSYRSAPPRDSLKTLKSGELPSTPSAEEGLSSNTGQGVGRGFASLGEPVMPPTYTEDEEKPLYLKQKTRKSKKVDFKDLMNMLVEIADIKDHSGDTVEADFTDFLIKKFAEQKEFDNSILFKRLIMKILDSNLVFYNEIIKDITAYYNRLIILYIDSGLSVNDAKRKAYSKVAIKAEKYVK